MNEHINAGQLQQIQNRAQDALRVAIEGMQLRKWSVEQAFGICSQLNGLKLAQPTEVPPAVNDPMALAAAVYDFVSQAAVVKFEID